jgi:hypothetical protein
MVEPAARRRIRAGDCLYALYTDLQSQARGLPPWDAAARERWLDSCAGLLAAVPDAAQRASWAYWLASALRGFGPPICVLAGHLLARASR